MADTEDKPKRRIWPRALLALSLALNVLVIGAVAGAAWRHGGPDGSGGKRGGPGGGIAMLRAMDAPDRRAVLRAARAARETDFDRAAHQSALVEVLAAEQLDVDAFDALIDAQQRAASARVAAVTQAWRAQVIAMTPEARSAYVARLAEYSRWHKNGGKR
jgi:uncharacterized membrane protein